MSAPAKLFLLAAVGWGIAASHALSPPEPARAATPAPAGDERWLVSFTAPGGGLRQADHRLVPVTVQATPVVGLAVFVGGWAGHLVSMNVGADGFAVIVWPVGRRVVDGRFVTSSAGGEAVTALRFRPGRLGVAEGEVVESSDGYDIPGTPASMRLVNAETLVIEFSGGSMELERIR